MLFWHISRKTVSYKPKQIPLCVSLQECFISKGKKKRGVGFGESIDIVASMT